jgi:hypothetical protein
MTNMTRQAVLDLVEAAINEEPEFPGEMPEDMYQAIVTGDRDVIAESLRIAARLTKKGILERVIIKLKQPQ